MVLMMNTREVCLVVLVSLMLIVSTEAARSGHLVGGRSEVKDVKTNKHVQNLGKFSVEEFNRGRIQEKGDCDSQGGRLRFKEVVEAEQQVASGMKYYLKIVAVVEKENDQIFDSVVVVKPWIQDSKLLLHFAPSSSPSN